VLDARQALSSPIQPALQCQCASVWNGHLPAVPIDDGDVFALGTYESPPKSLS
jgi:hypothetical protein